MSSPLLRMIELDGVRDELKRMKMEFNINNYVRVKLTQYGKDILKKQHDELYEKLPLTVTRYPFSLPIEDENGYSLFQMWSLMEHFGQYIHLGGEQPFETNIDILVKDAP